MEKLQLWLKNNGIECTLQELSSLERLILNKDLTEMPPEIGKLTNLQFLWFRLGYSMNIPSEIGQLKKLQWLRISNKVKNVPPEVGKLKNLQVLWLSDSSPEKISPRVGRLKRLQYLVYNGFDLNFQPLFHGVFICYSYNKSKCVLTGVLQPVYELL